MASSSGGGVPDDVGGASFPGEVVLEEGDDGLFEIHDGKEASTVCDDKTGKGGRRPTALSVATGSGKGVAKRGKHDGTPTVSDVKGKGDTSRGSLLGSGKSIKATSKTLRR